MTMVDKLSKARRASNQKWSTPPSLRDRVRRNGAHSAPRSHTLTCLSTRVLTSSMQSFKVGSKDGYVCTRWSVAGIDDAEW